MEELIKKAKEGDIGAYTEAFMKVRVDLKKFAISKLDDKSLADDIIQNVYYKAYKNLGKLEDNTKFKNWITTIVRNECLTVNNYSKTHLESDIDELVEIMEDSSIPNPESKVSFEDMIKDLTEEEKNLLRLKYEEAYTNKEIAEELGIPYNTVKSKILRAIKKITLVVLVLIMISGFTALAAFVIKQIKAHFTTSLNAINTAVENNYVQEIDGDFVYDNGIGIKVDAIVLDDKNLDISFVYDIQDKEEYGEITGIRLEEYIVKANNDKLFDSVVEAGKLVKEVKQYSENFETNELYHSNSILLSGFENFPKVSELTVEIRKIILLKNNNQTLVEGKWNLSNEIIDKLNSRKEITYVMEDNKYVQNSEMVLIDTALKLNITLNVNIDLNKMPEIVLYNEDSSKLFYSNCSYDEENKYIELIFDIGKYTEDINSFKLEIPMENKENIIIKFKRDG